MTINLEGIFSLVILKDFYSRKVYSNYKEGILNEEQVIYDLVYHLTEELERYKEIPPYDKICYSKEILAGIFEKYSKEQKETNTMNQKPNQTIDEITEAVYPPPEAVEAQLSTIRAIIPSTIKMYKDTGDIHTIQPNLSMIQQAIDYLKGMPMLDELKPIPEDTLNPIFMPAPGVSIQCSMNRKGEYDVSIVGVDVESKISNPDLFGEVDFKALETSFDIPVICGNTYTVTQENPMLEHYKDDPSISEKDGIWTKEKAYEMTEDRFEYSFLLGEGRSSIKIKVNLEEDSIAIFNIYSHIHFKKE